MTSKPQPCLASQPRCRLCAGHLFLLGEQWICCTCDFLDVTDQRVRLLSPQERGEPDVSDVSIQD
jgi:hypothetical protein